MSEQYPVTVQPVLTPAIPSFIRRVSLLEEELQINVNHAAIAEAAANAGLRGDMTFKLDADETTMRLAVGHAIDETTSLGTEIELPQESFMQRHTAEESIQTASLIAINSLRMLLTNKGYEFKQPNALKLGSTSIRSHALASCYGAGIFAGIVSDHLAESIDPTISTVPKLGIWVASAVIAGNLAKRRVNNQKHGETQYIHGYPAFVRFYKPSATTDEQ